MFRLSGGPEERVCPICGAPQGTGDSVCSDCGASLPEGIADALGEDRVVEAFMLLPGIGKNKAEALVDAGFRSLSDIKGADVDRLASARGVGDRLAQTIQEHIETGGMEEQDLYLCPGCGAFMSKDAAECSTCGAVFDDEEIEGDDSGMDGEISKGGSVEEDGDLFLCPSCGAFVSSDTDRCYNCNTLLVEDEEKVEDVVGEDLEIDSHDMNVLQGSTGAETLHSLGFEDSIIDDSLVNDQKEEALEELNETHPETEFSLEKSLEMQPLDETSLEMQPLDETSLENELLDNLVEVSSSDIITEEELEKALLELAAEDDEEPDPSLLEMDVTEDDVLFTDIDDSGGVIWEEEMGEEEPLGNLGVCSQCGAFIRGGQSSCEVCGAQISDKTFDDSGFIGQDDEDIDTSGFMKALGVKEEPVAAEEDVLMDEGAIYLCANCGAFMKESDETCGICGTSVSDMDERPPDYEPLPAEVNEALALCKECGAFINPSADACEICGTALGDEKVELGGAVVLEEDDSVVASDVLKSVLGERNEPVPEIVDDGEIFLCPNCGAFMSSRSMWCPMCNTFTGEDITEEEAKKVITDEIEAELDFDPVSAAIESEEDIEGCDVVHNGAVEQDYSETSEDDIEDIVPTTSVAPQPDMVPLSDLLEETESVAEDSGGWKEEQIATDEYPGMEVAQESAEESLTSYKPWKDFTGTSEQAASTEQRVSQPAVSEVEKGNARERSRYSDFADTPPSTTESASRDVVHSPSLSFLCPICGLSVGDDALVCPGCGVEFLTNEEPMEEEYADATHSIPLIPSNRTVVKAGGPPETVEIKPKSLPPEFSSSKRDGGARAHSIRSAVAARGKGGAVGRYAPKSSPLSKIEKMDEKPAAKIEVRSTNPVWERYRSMVFVSSVFVSLVMLLVHSIISNSWDEYGQTFSTGIFLAFGLYTVLGIALLATGLKFIMKGFIGRSYIFLAGVGITILLLMTLGDADGFSVSITLFFIVSIILCVLGALKMHDSVDQIWVWLSGVGMIFISALVVVRRPESAFTTLRASMSITLATVLIPVSIGLFAYDKWKQVVLASKVAEGDGMLQRREYSRAIDAFERAQTRRLESDSDERVWLSRGSAMMRTGRFEEAVDALNNAIRINPRNEVSWNNKGNALSQLMKLDEAMKCFREAVRLNPQYEIAWNNMGNAYARKEMYDQAIACYNRAISLNRGYRDAFINMGYVLVRQGRYEEAIACANRVAATAV